MAPKPKSEYHGSFIVNLTAVKILFEANATAIQICAFLTLSCFTGKEYGKYNSTASYNALVNRLGIGINKAKQLILDLYQMEYMGNKLIEFHESDLESMLLDEKASLVEITDKQDRQFCISDYFALNKAKHSFNRWKLPESSNKEIWFHKDLVGVGRSPDKPLKKLWRLCGSIATKLYLLMFCYNNLEEDLVSPGLLAYRFKLEEISAVNGFVLLQAKKSDITPYISDTITKLLFGDTVALDAISEKTNKMQIYESLRSLEQHGFIYSSVVTFLNEGNSEIAAKYYNLDCKLNDRAKNKEQYLCHDIKAVADQIGFKLSRKDNRFYDEYFAIAPSGMGVNVSMVYRLKYGVTNLHNYRIFCAGNKRIECNAEVREWLSMISPTSNFM